MSKKTDPKEDMVKAALRLFRARGFQGVGVAELLAESGFPRGSLYFHFPGGKEEIGRAAMRRQTDQDCENMLAANALCCSAEEFVTKVFAVIAERLRRSDFRAGCVVGAVTLETATSSPSLQAAAAECFVEMRNVMAEVLAHFGLPPEQARQAASAMLSGIQGATVLSRALNDAQPFTEGARAVCAYIAQLRASGEAA